MANVIKGGRKPEHTPLEARIEEYERYQRGKTAKQHAQHKPGSQRKGRNGS